VSKYILSSTNVYLHNKCTTHTWFKEPSIKDVREKLPPPLVRTGSIPFPRVVQTHNFRKVRSFCIN